MSGLRLPQILGTSDAEIEQAHKDYDNYDKIVDHLATLGFSPMSKPNYACPVLTPATLAAISLTEYATVHAQFNAWYNYAHNTLAQLKSHRLGLRNEQAEIERIVRKKIFETGVKLTKEQQTEQIESNPRHTALRQQISVADQTVMLAESHTETLERDLRLISRQIELIRMDHENTRTNNNVPSRGRGMGQLR